jgi:hypothetical protein
MVEDFTYFEGVCILAVLVKWVRCMEKSKDFLNISN